MSHKQPRAIVLFAFALVATWIGCGGRQDPPIDVVALRCASLEETLESENEPLRVEVLRLEEAGQTPLGLEEPLGDPEQNAAVLLEKAFSDGARARLFPRLENLVPDERFLFDSPRLGSIRDLVQGAALIRMAVARADAAPACVFDVRHDLGYFATMRFLDDAAIASRLHVLAAAPAIADGDLAMACDEVDGAFRWVDRLAAVPRIEARVQAAQLRGEALIVIEALAEDPSLQRADLKRLYAVLRRSLDNWPKDADPLIGDRALTLHSYEAIRAGLFDDLVTNEERQRLEARGLLRSMRAMTASLIDRDELAYLEAMRAIIAAAAEPFYARRDALHDALEPFDPNAARSVEVPMATQLFFPGLQVAMEEIARDRAACEVWALALATAGDLDLPPYQQNPVTGADYEVTRRTDEIIVRSGDPDLRDAYARLVPIP